MRRGCRRALTAVLAAAWLGLGMDGAIATDIEARLTAGGSATVASVVDGDTVVLDDGRQVRLVGIQAPKLPLGRKGFVEWPLAEAARKAVIELIEGRTVRLAFGGAGMDRHRRVLAHLFRDDGLWVQGDLLRRGFARVYTFPDNRALADAMYERERQAREERRGIWTDPFYRLRPADGLERDVDSFQVVEGDVRRAARVGERVFLNFAEDWRNDFTVVIAADRLPLFAEAGIEATRLTGRRIRVRGWIKSWNGPMIEATHPEQMEILPPR